MKREGWTVELTENAQFSNLCGDSQRDECRRRRKCSFWCTVEIAQEQFRKCRRVSVEVKEVKGRKAVK